MKVCFLLNDLGLAGGTGVVIEHAHQLATHHDMDVTLVVCGGSPEGAWGYRRLDGVRVIGLLEACEERFDVAVATWWRTAYDLFRVPAHRHAYFVQSLEDRFYERFADERFTAALTHTLPVAFITEAVWIRDLLTQFVPGSQVHYVRNGIDKDVFDVIDAVPTADGPLRVLVEGHPDVWFKGIGESVEVLGQMTEPYTATLVTSATDYELPPVLHRRVGPLPHEEMARLYAEHDVLLKTSRVEGMYGPPLEAFHRGATVVTTPVTGHDEYVEHGWNGLVADWDDLRGTARFLDLLARDRVFLHRLRRNAMETARAWPGWRQSGDVMAAALQAIHDGPLPDARQGALRLLGDVLVGVTEHGIERRQLIAEIHERRREVDHLQQDLQKVKGQIDDYHARLLAKGDELAEAVHSQQWAYGGMALKLLATRPGRIARAIAGLPGLRRLVRRSVLRLPSGT